MQEKHDELTDSQNSETTYTPHPPHEAGNKDYSLLG